MKLSIFLIVLFFNIINAGKIGIFVSAFHNSQLVFGYRLAEVLSKHHEIVMIRSEFNPKTRAFKNPIPEVREIYFQIFNSSIEFDKFADLENQLIYGKSSWKLLWEMSKQFNELFLGGCKVLLNDEKFLKDIEKEKFDVVFKLHSYDICPFAVMHHAKVLKWMYTMSSPVVEQVFRCFGIPSPPSSVPALFSNTTNQLTFVERKDATLSAAFTFIASKFYFQSYNQLIQNQFGPNFPSIQSLIRKSKLIFVNDFEVLEYPRFISPAVINIGSIGMDTSKPLQDEFKTFVEESLKPIVVVSFGTIANSKDFPLQWKKEFVNFFKVNENINFVWQFDDSTSITLPKNVLTKKWIPQTSLLANNKTVAFISHCGFNGLQEAILTMTPMICIPLFADHLRNSRLVEFKNIGTFLPKSMFSAEMLTLKLNKTLENESYLKSIKNFRSLILERPFNSTELLLRWTDYTIKHDFNFIFPDVSFIEYYNLDIFVPLGFAILLILSLIFWIFYRIFYWFCCNKALRDKPKLQ